MNKDVQKYSSGKLQMGICTLAIRQGVNILKPSRQLSGVMKPRKNTGFLFPYPVPVGTLGTLGWPALIRNSFFVCLGEEVGGGRKQRKAFQEMFGLWKSWIPQMKISS